MAGRSIGWDHETARCDCRVLVNKMMEAFDKRERIRRFIDSNCERENCGETIHSLQQKILLHGY